jgi:hypothetical protein
MTKEIEIKDLIVGTGAEATKQSIVVANIREFLRRGDEVSQPPLFGAHQHSIDLRRRDCIAGLLKGIPGIGVVGMREIIISPHLAYGEAGIPGRIPANALLRCEVELIGIREHGGLLPGDWVPGKILMLSHYRDANEEQMNWSFTLQESGNSSFIYFSQRLQDNHQKKQVVSQIPIRLEAEHSERLIRQAMDLPDEMAENCVAWDSGFIDNTGGAVIRDNRTGACCMVVQVMEGGKNLC